MSVFITQGRFTQEAIKGMLARSDDRAQVIGKLFSQAGGKLIAYYMTFGDHDFVVVSEGPFEGVVTSSIVVSAAGGVTDLTTTLAIPASEMPAAFARAAQVVSGFRAAGTVA